MKTYWLLVLILLGLIKVSTQWIYPYQECDLSRQFDCGNKCILKAWQCDNIKDCQNGTDEIDCEPNSCKEGEMLCDSGGCIPGAFKCDGHFDCYDNGDENYCGHISYSLSENYRFNFEDPKHYKYDGGYDKNGCLPGFGLCGKQKLCIPNRSFCDGTVDCVNEAEDEKECTRGGLGDRRWFGQIQNPCHNKFVCAGNASRDDEQVCINQEELCNGRKDCPLGDDESEQCRECATKGCEHRCRNTPNGAKCECNKGYQLDSDGFSCVDLDECTLPERACHHFCENTIGSFRCSCANGYHLEADGKSCGLPHSFKGFLLFEEHNEIKRKRLEDFTETNFTTMYKFNGTIQSFDYYRRDNKFFVSICKGDICENEKLLTGKNGEWKILRENVFGLTHLVVDWVGGNIFFMENVTVHSTDSSSISKKPGDTYPRDIVAEEPAARISVCTMDGKFCRGIIKTGKDSKINGLAIHPMRGLLFWIDHRKLDYPKNSKKYYPYRIMMANMDGSQVKTLVQSKSRNSGMFAIDLVNHDIYYENRDDERGHRIRRVNIDTRKTEVIASNLHDSAIAMAYHNGFLYWTNRYGNFRVLEVARKGASVHRVLKYDSRQINSLHMVVSDSLHQLEPASGNPCANLDCPWICVIVSGFTAKCLCPDGYTPSVLGTTCIPDEAKHDNLTYTGLKLMSDYCKTGQGCLNGGTCREVSNKTEIVCDCVEPYDGLYCERRKPMISDEAVLIIIPILIFLLAIIAIGCGVLIYRREKKLVVTDILLLVDKPSKDPFEKNGVMI
ncbi:unnamed protein product [Caenorhabditis brenneri]